MAVLQTVAVATVAAQVGGAVYRTLISKAAAGLVDTVQGVQQHVELPEVRAELTKLDLEATIGVVAGLTDAALDRYVARVDGVAPAGEDGAGTAGAAGAAGAGAGAAGAPAAGAAGMRRAPGSTQALPEFDAVARAATDLADTLDETRTLLLELQEAVARNKDRWFKHLRSSPYASLLSQLRAKRDLIDSRLKLLLTALEVSQRLADARDRDAALAAATRTLPPAAAAATTTTTALAPPLPLALPAPAVQEQEQAQEEEQQPPSEVAGGAAAADGAPSADDVVADFVLTSAEAAKAAVDAAVAEAYAQADSGGMPRTTTTTSSTAGAAAAAPNDDNSSEPAPPLHREQDVPVTASQMFTAL